MHALVTGAGGFLGRYIVEALLARGNQVRGLARGEYPQLQSLGVEMIRGDVADRFGVGGGAGLPGADERAQGGGDGAAYRERGARGTGVSLQRSDAEVDVTPAKSGILAMT